MKAITLIIILGVGIQTFANVLGSLSTSNDNLNVYNEQEAYRFWDVFFIYYKYI